MHLFKRIPLGQRYAIEITSISHLKGREIAHLLPLHLPQQGQGAFQVARGQVTTDHQAEMTWLLYFSLFQLKAILKHLETSNTLMNFKCQHGKSIVGKTHQKDSVSISDGFLDWCVVLKSPKNSLRTLESWNPVGLQSWVHSIHKTMATFGNTWFEQKTPEVKKRHLKNNHSLMTSS